MLKVIFRRCICFCLLCSLSEVLSEPLPVIEKNEQQLSVQVNVWVNKIKLRGNTVFSNDQLSEVTGKYQGRRVSMNEIQQLRRELTLYYVNRGYISSGAVIPDQKIDDGIIVFQITEGSLSGIDIVNADELRLKPTYIQKRIQLDNSGPLNLLKLQNRLQLMHQNPLINKLETHLSPGTVAGESILGVKVDESKRFHSGVTLDNGRSPSVGEVHFGAWISDGNFSRNGDMLSLQLGTTEGLRDGNIRYTIPVSSRDASLSFSGSRSESEIIEEPFDQINITSITDSWALTFEYPVKQSTDGYFKASVSLEKRKSESLLSDLPFQFSPGANDGIARVSVIRLGQNWLKKNNNSVVAMNSRFSIGVDALNSTINDGDTPDSEFINWNGQVQWVQRINKINVMTRFNMQLSKEPLLSMEKFGLGGSQSVRGYRSNLFVRDQGVSGSVEMRKSIRNENLQFAIFLEGGFAKNKYDETGSDSIGSAGLGVLWNPLPRLKTTWYIGEALKDVDLGQSSNLQDDGFHFSLAYSF